MKRIWLVFGVLVLLLSGCSGEDALMERSLAIRSSVLSAQRIQFTCTVTADYGDRVFSFTAACTADQDGNIAFEITQPESIAGITGTLSAQGGKLTFDDIALDFGLLAEQMPSPVSGPYVLLQALRSGYIRAYSSQDGTFRMTVDESYRSDSLSLDICFDRNDIPVYAQISFQGQTLLTMEISAFTLE